MIIITITKSDLKWVEELNRHFSKKTLIWTTDILKNV